MVEKLCQGIQPPLCLFFCLFVCLPQSHDTCFNFASGLRIRQRALSDYNYLHRRGHVCHQQLSPKQAKLRNHTCGK